MKNILIILFIFIYFLSFSTKPLELAEYMVYLNSNPFYTKEDRNKYERFYKYYEKTIKYIRDNEEKNALKEINKYIKKNRKALKKNRFVDDYILYGFISYFLLLKGIILYENNPEIGSELIYLNFYILGDLKMLNRIKLDASRDNLAMLYRELLYNILNKSTLEDTKQEIKNDKFYLNSFYYGLFIDKETRERYLKMDSISNMTYTAVRFGNESEMDIRYKPLENLSSFKSIEDAFTVFYGDKESADEFKTLIANKAGLNITKTEKKGDYKGIWVGIVRNDELGQKLLKKHVFKLR